MCDDVIPNGCWWIIMVYGSSCWNDIKWPDWTLWVQALKSDAGSRGSPSPVHDSDGFSVQFNPLNNWISTEVLQHVWNDPCKCITVAACCSRVVCSIFALVFQVLSIISQGSVASSPMQKVIDNGSAARKAGAHWMCPFWGRMTWMDMNGKSFGHAFLFFHSCFYALNRCLGGCWGVQNRVSRMGRGAWRNSNWNWSKSRLTAEFDTSTQALTNSNQQSLNLNLSKHLNFTGHYTLFYKFVYRFLTNLSVFLSVPCGTCSPQDRAEAYFGSELEMASSVASKDCAFLLFPRHLPTNDYCGVCVFGALKFKDSCLCFGNLGKQPTILVHSTLGW